MEQGGNKQQSSTEELAENVLFAINTGVKVFFWLWSLVIGAIALFMFFSNMLYPASLMVIPALFCNPSFFCNMHLTKLLKKEIDLLLYSLYSFWHSYSFAVQSGLLFINQVLKQQSKTRIKNNLLNGMAMEICINQQSKNGNNQLKKTD